MLRLDNRLEASLKPLDQNKVHQKQGKLSLPSPPVSIALSWIS